MVELWFKNGNDNDSIITNRNGFKNYGYFQPCIGARANLDDVMPDILSPEDRDILSACRDIDKQYRQDMLSFMRHCL